MVAGVSLQDCFKFTSVGRFGVGSVDTNIESTNTGIGVELILPRWERYFSFTVLLIRKKLLPLTAGRLQRVTASSFTWRYLMAYMKQNSTVTRLRPAAQRSEVTGSSFREVKNLQVTDDDNSDASVNVIGHHAGSSADYIHTVQ